MPSPWYHQPTYPGGRPRIWDRTDVIGTGRGLVGKGELIQVRIDTAKLTSQLKGKGPQIGGQSYQAMKRAHSRLGHAVREKALANLEATLITARRNVNEANKRRHRGIRAALHDPRNTIVDPSGRFWGVGDQRVFSMYGALSYYRVIERGGGFRGRIWGLLLDENEQPTRGPLGGLERPRKAERLLQGAISARYQAESLAKRYGGQTFYGSKRKAPAGVRRQIEFLQQQDKALVEQARAAKYGKRRKAFGPTGQPRKDWRNIAGSAAMSVKPMGMAGRGGKGGWWFVVRNPVTAKNYLSNAMREIMDSDMPRTVYNEEFIAKGLPFRYFPAGAPLSGYADDAAAAAAYWKEHTTQLGSVARHSG